ncbi:flagellar biosynthetic protein FliR [Parazoarcus communis]|uniref:Flagellar biosynthetic protein FliR n=1 Tax=Parazoarcus communis SWub3 = DSM 12120 TaxID=1121029 RepID=A0A323UV93_9RHOO|nr:flagellar biosynthetic protein FliR [Parazoarcus communis]NMG69054.1 flagellar biosynthetic protein FliR [Parazoarcus communis SWub3 = DSM 12120]PZA16912.1 flagellar biosynthetic protein FliR [Azoarcus communis] [Parazoarcus communis SWub3 = DSM 12120]
MGTTEALFDANRLLLQAQAYWWPFCRILAVLTLAPVFSHSAVSIRIRVLLALALTLALGGALPAPPTLEALSLAGILATLEQLAFGVMLGLALQLVFTVYSVIGETISTQMGMSMARYNDPQNGVSSSSVLYQVYYTMLVLMFFAIDGHLVLISVLYQSFIFWPIGAGIHFTGLTSTLQALSWALSAAVMVSLPLVFCMTLVLFGFGLLNRISPAMNLFALGFPIAILTGWIGIFLTLPNLAETYLLLTRQMLDNLNEVLRS